METVGDLIAALEHAIDLDVVKRALTRETMIREAMAETGESREIVTGLLDAMDSMDREAVTDLMEGKPTTLRAALAEYITVLEQRDELQPRDRVLSDLTALLAYPWSGEEATIGTHGANASVRLEVTEINPSSFSAQTSIKVGGVEVYRDENDREGAAIAEDVAEAVHRALLARVIGDREHIVQLSPKQTVDLQFWLTRPNGSHNADRLTVEAVVNGGLLIRTKPYVHVTLPASRH